MRRNRSGWGWRCAAAMLLVAAAFSHAVANPKERIDYWRNNYAELTAADDSRAERAHDIFERLVHAAGRTLGVVPRLFILKRNPLNIAMPIAIPDGWVIISRGTLDICYRHARHGDDRLAFVLAHELAHQLKGDFWHMQFFQALEASQAQGAHPPQTLAEIRRVLQETNSIWAKELQADEHGILYAAMAGFQTHAIVAHDERGNFFQEWVDALSPTQVGAAYQGGKSHPAPRQRAAAVQARLQQAVDKTALFDVGLRFYQAGDYTRSIRAFEAFLEYFPSREVYLNLAASHHQLALQLYQLQPLEDQAMPFQLSMAVDLDTRARGVSYRGLHGPQARFQAHMNKAIEFYETAKSLDPTYALAHNNLGCAYITNGEPFKAIATLQDGLKLTPEAPDTLNNLGVAFFTANLAEPAKSHLYKASILNPRYAAPLFNLGKIAYQEQQPAEARRLWQAYLRLDAVSPWAERLQQQDAKLRGKRRPRVVRKQADERVRGVAVATFEDEMPAAWGPPKSIRLLFLEEAPLTLRRYPQGMMTFAQSGEIVMIFAEAAYRGKSARGIAIGSAQSEVMDQYRTPSRILKMTQGETWMYDKLGISFQLREGRVASWLLF